MKKYLAILLLFCCSVECMNKLTCFKQHKGPSSHHEVMKEVLDYQKKKTDLAVNESTKSWYRNSSRDAVFEGAIWLGGGFIFSIVILCLLFSKELSPDTSTLAAMATGLGLSGWGAKRIKHGLENKPANNKTDAHINTYANAIQAFAVLPEEELD